MGTICRFCQNAFAVWMAARRAPSPPNIFCFNEQEESNVVINVYEQWTVRAACMPFWAGRGQSRDTELFSCTCISWISRLTRVWVPRNMTVIAVYVVIVVVCFSTLLRSSRNWSDCCKTFWGKTIACKKNSPLNPVIPLLASFFFVFALAPMYFFQCLKWDFSPCRFHGLRKCCQRRVS